MNWKRNVCLSLLFCSLFIHSSVFAEAPGKISGKVIDNVTKEEMIAANVVVVGTSLGVATDANGNFIIQSVPPGTYTIKTSYIGYKSDEKKEVRVVSGQTTTLNFELVAVGLTTEGIVVTAQAQGQNQAINQQLASDRITNVVSSARIQELPDANAAESIARLPGISIQREGGEGDKIVIRGLQPKYNAIAIDGVRMASSDPNDRSTDMSMISSNMLEGIEVSKTVTPDQDADVLGGTVNFKLREAKNEQEGLGVELLAQGGYNGLSNAPNKFNNYKYVGSVEGRFFDQKLGVFVQADLERRNLASNELTTAYAQTNNALTGSTLTDYKTNTITINTIPRDRQRSNGTVLLDYKLPEGKISLSNFFSTGTTEQQNRGETYDVVNSYHDYNVAYSKSTLNMVTNALDIEQQLPIFHANLKLSHTYSETKDPNDWTVNFREQIAGNGSQTLAQLYSGSNLDPRNIPAGVMIDTNTTYLQGITNTSSFSRERALTASLDFDANMNISDLVNAIIKFGGKYRHQTRSYISSTSGSNAGLESTNGAAQVDELIAAQFQIPGTYGSATTIPIRYFMDPGFDYGKFLNGDFQMHMPLKIGRASCRERVSVTV
jgi:TonB-dependent receptor